MMSLLFTGKLAPSIDAKLLDVQLTVTGCPYVGFVPDKWRLIDPVDDPPPAESPPQPDKTKARVTKEGTRRKVFIYIHGALGET